MHTQSIAEQNKSFQEAETTLRKELGKAYDGQVANAQGLITKFGSDEVNKAIGDSGLGRNPVFIKFMMEISKNFGENGELLGEANQPHILSPEDALKEIAKIKGDKDHPWHKKDHAEHAEAMKAMSSLFEQAYPEEKK